tara:strand:+ start:1147 stop:1377 length:231 start_codon:yes stop_codon:yes gene_type:complete
MGAALRKPQKLVDLIKGEGHYKNLDEKSRYRLFNRWRHIYHLESKEIDLSYYINPGELTKAYDKGFDTKFVCSMSR